MDSPTARHICSELYFLDGMLMETPLNTWETDAQWGQVTCLTFNSEGIPESAGKGGKQQQQTPDATLSQSSLNIQSPSSRFPFLYPHLSEV